MQDYGLSESRLGFTEGCGVSDRNNPPSLCNDKSLIRDAPASSARQAYGNTLSNSSDQENAQHLTLQHLMPIPTKAVTLSG